MDTENIREQSSDEKNETRLLWKDGWKEDERNTLLLVCIQLAHSILLVFPSSHLSIATHTQSAHSV